MVFPFLPKSFWSHSCQDDPRREMFRTFFVEFGFSGEKSSPFQSLFPPIHHKLLCVLRNNHPLLAATDEFVASPSEFTDTNSNFGLARNTKQSPPWFIE
jgi:hypothetical protein